MATTDRVAIEIYVDDKGSIQIRNVKKELESLGPAAQSATAGSDSLASSLGGIAVAAAGIAVVTAGVHQLVSAFSAGIKAIDSFQQTTIGIAAGLTSMAAEGQGTFAEMFKRNLSFSKEMYEAMRIEDAKRFASLDDLMMGYNALVQKGYGVRLEEVNALGILVDKIKLATAGQNTGLQINQEIRSLMDGQARAGSLIATELRDRIGPGWEEVVNQHRQAGTLLEYLSGLWPGIEAAAEEIEKTLEAQTTTLEGNLKYVGREGLAGAYEDIVGIVAEINGYLREHGDQVASNIARAWEVVRDIVLAVKGFILDIYAITSKTITITVQVVTSIVGPAASWLTGVGKGGAGDIMMGFGGTSFDEIARQRAAEPPAGPQYIGLGDPVGGQTIPRPRIASGGGGGGGGGKGGGGDLQSSLDQMQRIINSLQKDLSRLTEGGLSEIDAWEKSQLDAIEKVARKGAEAAEARAMVEKVKQAKIYKLNEDFDAWFAGQVKDQNESIKIEEEKYIRKYQGNQQQLTMIAEVFSKKRKEFELNAQNELLGIFEDNLNKLNGVQTNLGDQISLQKILIGLEDQRNKNALELLVLNEKITSEQAGELRRVQEITAREKLRKAGAPGEGMRGGLQDWASERAVSGARAGYDRGRNVMDSLERSIIDQLKNLTGSITKALFRPGEAEFDFGEFATQLGELIVNTLLNKFVEVAIQSLFTFVAQALTSAGIMSTAGIGLTGAAAALTASAGVLTSAASMMMAVSVKESIPIIGHTGIIVAHGGHNLASDERYVKAQVGEWILNKKAVGSLMGQGVSFGALNSGNLPKKGGGSVFNYTYAPRVNHRMSQSDYNQDARKMWRAHDRERKRRGL